MSVTAQQINELTLKNKNIDIIIKEQLQIIDDKLLHSRKFVGKNYITYDLPYNLPSIPGVNKSDLQKIIYTSIIVSLEKRGFIVKILLENLVSVLYISWVTELNDNSVQTMNSILKHNRITKDELTELMNR